MDNLEKVYNRMREFMDKNGFPPTIKQIANELNIREYEAKEAFEELQKSGRIKITDIPRRTIIEFVD